jgi:mRNA interferase HigB
MHIISYKTLRDYSSIHSDCREALSNWYQVASKAKWSNLVEVQQVFPTAEAVSNFTVFNIKGKSRGFAIS